MSIRFRGIEDNHLIAVATIFDPRFKLPFANSAAVENHRHQLVAEVSSQTVPVSQPLQPVYDTTSAECDYIWQFFDKQVAACSTRQLPSVTALTEIDQYIKLPLLGRKEDPLLWWKVNAHLFPSLSKIARRYLMGIATSVPAERLFSKAGKLVFAKRIGIL